MGSKAIIGLCLAALLVTAGVVGALLAGNRADSNPPAAAPSPSPAAATPALPALPAFPTPSTAGDRPEARRLAEVNRIIAEVTEEAMQRPKDQRMTADQINELINSRIEQLQP